MEKEEKEEITVKAPPKPVIPPEKKAEKVAEKALEEERFGVLQVSRKVGIYFSASMLLVGVLLPCLFMYVILTEHIDWIIISPKMNFLVLLLWIFVSIVNIIGGFLLVGSE